MTDGAATPSEGPEGGPDDEPIECVGVRISRATGCFRDLNWDLQLAWRLDDWASLGEVLAGWGWREGSRLEGLLDFQAPHGHHLVAVPRSEWLQLRLSYLVPAEERRALARELAEALAAGLTSRTRPPPGCRSGRR